MTKKELERENARLKAGLEKIREIADNPHEYVKKKLPDLADCNDFAASLGAILTLARVSITGVIGE